MSVHNGPCAASLIPFRRENRSSGADYPPENTSHKIFGVAEEPPGEAQPMTAPHC